MKDEVVAYLDHAHVAYAKHPIIDRTREYFALQVDAHEAAFDNVQIFTAAAKRGEEATAAQAKLEEKYPQLFVTSDEIRRRKQAARAEVKDDPDFKKANEKRAAAFRAQQAYLLENDEELARLAEQLEAKKREAENGR